MDILGAAWKHQNAGVQDEVKNGLHKDPRLRSGKLMARYRRGKPYHLIYEEDHRKKRAESTLGCEYQMLMNMLRHNDSHHSVLLNQYCNSSVQISQ